MVRVPTSSTTVTLGSVRSFRASSRRATREEPIMEPPLKMTRPTEAGRGSLEVELRGRPALRADQVRPTILIVTSLRRFHAVRGFRYGFPRAPERRSVLVQLRTPVPTMGDEPLVLAAPGSAPAPNVLPRLPTESQLWGWLFDFNTFRAAASKRHWHCMGGGWPPGGLERGMGDTNHCPAAPFFCAPLPPTTLAA